MIEVIIRRKPEGNDKKEIGEILSAMRSKAFRRLEAERRVKLRILKVKP